MFSFRFALVVLFSFAFASANAVSMAQGLEATPFRPSPPSAASSLFEEIPASASGIDFVQPIDVTHPLKCLYVGGYASPGVAIGDLDGDDLADVFISGGPVENRLYLNVSGDREPKFRDATDAIAAASGTGGLGRWAAGVTFVDIDNDGDLDIYVCNYDSPNQLFVNETASPGKLRFKESAKAFGLDLVDASFVGAFCDYDLDGDLDVLVSGYQYVNPAGRPAKPPVVERDGKYSVLPQFQKYYGVVQGIDGRPTFTNVGRQDRLLRSNASDVANGQSGQVKFEDVTKPAGLSDRGVGNSVLWWDFNGDRLPDLYVGNDFKVADQLYRNNGDGTFTDVIRDSFAHTTWFSMGSEAGDVNNDGRLDLFVSDMAGTNHYRSKVTMGEMSVHREFMKTAEPRQYMRNALLLNTGSPRFAEAAYMAGLAKSDWSWAVKLADLDNDGRLDVYITNGAARMFNHSDRNFTDDERIGKTQWELWENTPPRKEENLAFRNKGDLKFENVGAAWGLEKNSMSYAAAYGDLDNDGDLDLVVANLDEPVSVYRNNSSLTKSRSIRFKLVGTTSNRSGLSATVRVRTGDVVQTRQLMPTMGFLSCNEPLLHVGVGDNEFVDEVVVTWPTGSQQTFRDVASNQLYTVTESSNADAAAGRDVAFRVNMDELVFAPSRTFPALRHVEKEFDDYARQPLLPYVHSQLGPAIATADVDGDGDMDFYHGRSTGMKRAVYINKGRGVLGVNGVLPDTKYEDMGALFFDADGDGDKDLYCVSGSVECDPESDVLRDRLYVNDGKGVFTPSADALPDLRDSGSVVCGADFDHDGDIDLFVGSRVIPGKYPVSPKSRLLKNESAADAPKFVDATKQVSPALLSTGLVTSAVWSDANNDGWVDLLVTHEWGPVKYYRNEPSSASSAASSATRVLVDRTKEAGLQSRFGWWNGIAARDLDNDGDVDYVVTNFGLNTQYKASDKKPELLYYGSFDGGAPRLLEAKFEADKCFPRRGLSCSSHAMPFVRSKVKTFHNFGMSTLEEIYTEEKLNESLQLSANVLESGVLINQSETAAEGAVPEFRFQPLPRMAQISPAFGVVLHDFNADGWCDVFVGQNFFSPQHETGRMDSGLSSILFGRGVAEDGTVKFDVAGPLQSGIAIPGDAKSCSLVDFNQDGWSDLLVGVNNGPILAYEARPHRSNKIFRVKLIGNAGNVDCVGAQVTVEFSAGVDRQTQTAEVNAGGGYLSQSTPILSFGAGSNVPQNVSVTWPDGRKSQHDVKAGQWGLAIRMP